MDLIISMKNGEHLSLEQIKAFLEGNEDIRFKAANRKDLYEWTQATLCAQGYMSLPRAGKGLVKQYISKVTGLSRAQATRLPKIAPPKPLLHVQPFPLRMSSHVQPPFIVKSGALHHQGFALPPASRVTHP